MTFNPAAYVLTASETLDRKKKRDAFVKDNGHLALDFPVAGLEKYIPPIQIGEVGVLGMGSHHGKSLFLKHWLFEAQKKVERSGKRAVVAYVSHEDTGEMTAQQQIKKYKGNETLYEDDLFLYIGRSFGMKAEDIAELYMTNIIRTLDYGMNKKFAEPMPYAAIGYDFIQKTPPDPERRKMTNDSQRRLQLADDSARLGNAAITLKAPMIVASQTGLKGRLNSPYIPATKDNPGMAIPGDGDFEEAKEIFQYADHAYTGWLARMDYPVGSFVECGKWSFEVLPNLLFIRILKARYCDPVEWKGIGKVYPTLIQDDGSIIYDAELHKKIYKGKSNG